MRLTVVGCAGSFPNAVSAGSCYLLEQDGFALLLDLGNGAIGSLARHIDIATVDAVALSHFHVDHCADMGPLYVTRRYDPRGSGAPIPVFGPAGVAQRMNQMYGLSADETETMAAVFDFQEYPDFAGEAFKVGPFTIQAVEVAHCIPSFALRVSAGGRTLIYSGDTGECVALTQAARGADLALFEASYVDSVDNPADMHLTGSQAGRTATEAGVPKLILTHLVAWNDDAEVLADARRTYFGDLSQAHPGLTITV